MTILEPNNNYYGRGEVSNSDLTELKNILHPRMQFGDKEAAFRFGSLVDAIITEPSRVNYYLHRVDNVEYSSEEWNRAMEMHKSLLREAEKDAFLKKVLEISNTQICMVNPNQTIEYGDFAFELPTRCKWDWWLPTFGFGGDLKTTFATTVEEFENAISSLREAIKDKESFIKRVKAIVEELR